MSTATRADRAVPTGAHLPGPASEPAPSGTRGDVAAPEATPVLTSGRAAGAASGTTDEERAAARYGVLLFALIVLFQRFAVPGSPVSLLVPILLGWGAWGLHRGLLVVDRTRMLLWLAAAGATALVGPLQVMLTHAPLVSVASWALMLLTPLPAVLAVAHRTRVAHQLFLDGVSRVAAWFAGLSYLFMASQAVVPYHDWFATLVPQPLQLAGYVYTYPIAWQSPIYRSNAWIGLEASWTAFLLGLGILAGLLSQAPVRRILWIAGGMLCTFSGSGLQLVAVGVLAMLVGRRAGMLRPYRWGALGLVLVAALTPAGQSVFARLTEAGDNRSSTALRGITPYLELWPRWATDLTTVLLGRGAGASQRMADDTGITGLLAPTATKVFMDYGLVAGLFLFCFLVAIMLRSPQPAVALALGLSLWTLQTPTAVFLAATIAVVSVWAPPLPAAHRPQESP